MGPRKGAVPQAWLHKQSHPGKLVQASLTKGDPPNNKLDQASPSKQAHTDTLVKASLTYK